MNWAKVLGMVFQAIQLVPTVVQGIQKIHGDALAGTSKKNLALESIMLSSGVASVLDPKDTETINAVTNLVGYSVDSSVALYKAVGHPLFGGTPAVSTPAAQSAAASVLAAASAPAPTSAPDSGPTAVQQPGDAHY